MRLPGSAAPTSTRSSRRVASWTRRRPTDVDTPDRDTVTLMGPNRTVFVGADGHGVAPGRRIVTRTMKNMNPMVSSTRLVG
jgi:hypothetical protein